MTTTAVPLLPFLGDDGGVVVEVGTTVVGVGLPDGGVVVVPAAELPLVDLVDVAAAGLAAGVTVGVAAVAVAVAFALPDPVFELVALLAIFQSSFIVMNCFDHNSKFSII